MKPNILNSVQYMAIKGGAVGVVRDEFLLNSCGVLSTYRINRILVCDGLALVLPVLSNNFRLASALVLNAILYIS